MMYAGYRWEWLSALRLIHPNYHYAEYGSE
jgi:hypothetical protein